MRDLSDGAVRSAPGAVRRGVRRSGSTSFWPNACGRCPESQQRLSRRTLRSDWTTSAASPSCRRVFRCRAIARASRRRWTPWTKGSSRRWGCRSCAAAASGVRYRRCAARRSRQRAASRNTTGRAPTPWASASGSTAAPAHRSRSSASRRRSSIATASTRPMDFVYLPLAQHPVARMVLLLRSSGDPLQMVKPVKDVVRTLDSNMPMLETRTYEDLYRYYAVDGPRVAVELVGHAGRGGPPAGHRRLVRTGGVQREPQDPRDRHPHRPSARDPPTCCAW